MMQYKARTLYLFLLFFFWALFLLGNSPSYASEETTAWAMNSGSDQGQPTTLATGTNFIDQYVKDHFRIGTRTVYRLLTDDDSGHRGGAYGSGTYLGTVYGLDEEQNMTPLYLFASYYFNEYIGLELSYDSIEVETVAVNVTTMVDKTDGNATIEGPTLNLLVRYPNSTDIVPYIGVGFGFYSGDFDPDANWEYNPQYDGRAYNHMVVDDVVGVIFTVGTEWNFYDNWLLDLSMQYVKADVDATYYGYYDDALYTTQLGHFPMDNLAFRLGIAYQF